MSSNKKIKIIAFLGKGGAGKTTAQELLCKKKDYHQIISCTTRPQREREYDGVHYHFLTHQEFTQDLYDEKFIEALEFNGWFYGARLEDLDSEKINVGVFTPGGIRALLETADIYNLKVMVVFVQASGKARLLRSISREKNPDISEVCRRFLADEKDFAEIDFDIAFEINNDGKARALASSVKMIDKHSKDFFVQG